jgi:hypothetical protein
VSNNQPGGNHAAGPHLTKHAMTTYRIITIKDPRTPGFRWWEIEARDAATGTTETVAVCDTKEEARATLRAMEAAK